MLKIIAMVFGSVWLTSSLFMLGFWLNAMITTLRRDGKIFLMPFGTFLYFHFCPIVHTIQCFKIMKKAAELNKREV